MHSAATRARYDPELARLCLGHVLDLFRRRLGQGDEDMAADSGPVGAVTLSGSSCRVAAMNARIVRSNVAACSIGREWVASGQSSIVGSGISARATSAAWSLLCMTLRPARAAYTGMFSARS